MHSVLFNILIWNFYSLINRFLNKLILIIILGVLIFCRKPSYREIKEKLELTKYIVVYDLTANEELKKQINDTKLIREITNILNEAKIDNSGWETTTGNKYRLELYANSNKMISQVFININYNNPVYIKYKDYDYSLKLKQTELLNTIIDNYIELNS